MKNGIRTMCPKDHNAGFIEKWPPGRPLGRKKTIAIIECATQSRSVSRNSLRVRVEVELTPKLTVESDVCTNQRTGVGLKWKHYY